MISSKREELLEKIKECYTSLMYEKLPIYGVPKGPILEKYYTTRSDIKKGIEMLPPDELLIDDIAPRLARSSTIEEDDFLPTDKPINAQEAKKSIIYTKRSG